MTMTAHRLLLICLMWATPAVWGGQVSHAQTTQVNGQILTQINAGAGTGGADQLQVTLLLQAAGDAFDIGTSTLQFTFNQAGLAIPSGAAISQPLTAGTDYAFQEPFASDPLYNKSVTVFGAANRLSVNLELFVPNMGRPIATSFTPVVAVFFDITDPSQTSMLTWITSGDANSTVIVAESNAPGDEIPLGTFVGDNTVLPVELVSLSAIADNTAIHVRWETASEVNFAGFAVEVQREGGDWLDDGFVSARGGSAFGARYSYTVQNVQAGTYAIRLREVDTDGTIDYSPTVQVKVEVIEAVVQSVAYPNPFNQRAQVDVALSRAQHLTAELYDVRGRRLQQLYAGHVAAHQTLTLHVDGEALPAGIYVVQFTGERFMAHQQLVHR